MSITLDILAGINLAFAVYWQAVDKYDRSINCLLWAIIMAATAKGIF